MAVDVSRVNRAKDITPWHYNASSGSVQGRCTKVSDGIQSSPLRGTWAGEIGVAGGNAKGAARSLRRAALQAEAPRSEIQPARRSLGEAGLPRPVFKKALSARTSNGFLLSAQRLRRSVRGSNSPAIGRLFCQHLSRGLDYGVGGERARRVPARERADADAHARERLNRLMPYGKATRRT